MTKSFISKGIAVRITLILLVASLLCGLLTACSVKDSEKPVLEYGKIEISRGMYEFMLSRMKATLARNKYDVSVTSDFWSESHAGTQLTHEEYYNQSILDNCKNYLAALVIFEEEGLSLSKSVLNDIEEEISFYIEYDGQGEEKKLDAILSKYGISTEELREIYTLEAKYQAVIAWLYGADGSLISDTVKQEYYEKNYYRFKQILISNFYYEYQTDEQGNIIYFDPESSEPIYDKENGVYVYDSEGNRVKDSYGNTVYYDEDGNILYDKENGYPSVTLDESGQGITYYYTDEEMAERAARAEELYYSFAKGNYKSFEAEIPEWELFENESLVYPDGFYLSRIESSGYEDYILDILEALEDMEYGETAMVESDYGYHIIMKYELDEGKYSDEEYSAWFDSFDSSLITKLFLDRCSEFYGDIKVNEENLGHASSIKSIGTNFDY